MAVVEPRQARTFARDMSALAETDSLDARMLAEFARVLHLDPEGESIIKPLANAELQRLQALALRRRQRHSPVFKASYARLVGAGKPEKVELVAAMRKLLTGINAIPRSGQRWDKSLHSAGLARRLLNGSAARPRLRARPGREQPRVARLNGRASKRGACWGVLQRRPWRGRNSSPQPNWWTTPSQHAGLKVDEGDIGAVPLIRRFGSAANLNIQPH